MASSRCLSRFCAAPAIGAALFVPALAFAQAAPEAEPAPQSEGLEEIVVTATKRAQDVQDVPIAISALTGDDLVDRNITNTMDLMGALPNLQVTTAYGKTQPNFSLRGISVANEFNSTTASPVGVYVDEVYQSLRASHGGQLFDLERIEVVRGPQGTLFGRNTTGGAVNFFTRKPALGETNGELSAGYANYDTWRVAGAAEFTLIPDVLGVRFAGQVTQGDGYTKDPFDGRDYGTTDSFGARVTLLWAPSEAFEATFKLYASQDDPRGDAPVGIGQNPNGTNIVGYNRFDPARPKGATPGRGLREDEVEADTQGEYYTSTAGGVLTLKYSLGDAWEITSITGFDVAHYDLSPFDCDGSPFNLCAIRYDTRSKSWNQDLRVNYDADRLRVVGGFYAGRDRTETHNQPDFFNFLVEDLGVPVGVFNPPIGVGIGIIPDGTAACGAVVVDDVIFASLAPAFGIAASDRPPGAVGWWDARSFLDPVNCGGQLPISPIQLDQFYELSRPSFALYGEAEYDISEALTITAGLRYTWDTLEYRDGHTLVMSSDRGAIMASTVPYSFPYDPSLPDVEQSEKTRRVTGRVIARYAFTESISAYASYSRGYRAGAYNALAYQGTSQVYLADPEQVDAYELGMKSRFLDDRMQLNGAFFYYDYKNQQIQEVIQVTSYLRNVDGRLYGIELEALMQLADWWRVDSSLGWLDTRYDDDQILNPVTNVDIGGNQFQNAPDFTFTIGNDVTLLTRDAGSLITRFDANYMGNWEYDPYQGRIPASPQLDDGSDPYWLLNTRIAWDSEHYTISGWVKNLTDEYYNVYGLNINPFLLDYFQRGAPRTYGIDFTYKF
jgi:iron complex outermembrane receptor protein